MPIDDKLASMCAHCDAPLRDEQPILVGALPYHSDCHAAAFPQLAVPPSPSATPEYCTECGEEIIGEIALYPAETFPEDFPFHPACLELWMRQEAAFDARQLLGSLKQPQPLADVADMFRRIATAMPTMPSLRDVEAYRTAGERLAAQGLAWVPALGLAGLTPAQRDYIYPDLAREMRAEELVHDLTHALGNAEDAQRVLDALDPAQRKDVTILYNLVYRARCGASLEGLIAYPTEGLPRYFLDRDRMLMQRVSDFRLPAPPDAPGLLITMEVRTERLVESIARYRALLGDKNESADLAAGEEERTEDDDPA